MALVGKIIRFDDVRGYGFIASSSGGEDVFVHANDFGDRRHEVHPGMRVEYEVEEGERGLKAASVQILDTPTTRAERPAGERAHTRAVSGDDDGLCDVLSPREFKTEVTELLIERVPTLSGAQIATIRQALTERARTHGWVEA
ncbi:cold-shock protein [Micromonospora cathayae]|uniref:Cold shock domain-containing protein n=1 Tax=Micromonospora cathayae TaxID=3028804 RepID=A0ABY7ZL87_9ACTN|nr:cold shock domain-containing protein [Micromonospora sp. HUAS 3]WDZ83710.1 cold shock domain-containing protein [Micromonospora sp. HUAS 3]